MAREKWGVQAPSYRRRNCNKYSFFAIFASAFYWNLASVHVPSSHMVCFPMYARIAPETRINWAQGCCTVRPMFFAHHGDRKVCLPVLRVPYSCIAMAPPNIYHHVRPLRFRCVLILKKLKTFQRSEYYWCVTTTHERHSLPTSPFEHAIVLY